jgi:DNA-binding transcriptional ArsR family regulator
VLNALADHRRRVVLAALVDGPTPITDATLARRVATAERTPDQAETVDRPTPQSVVLSLVHVHLPVLADAGLVEPTPEGVAPTDRLDALLRTCPVQSLLDDDLAVPPDAVDRGLDLLAHETRRQAIEELAARRRLSLPGLAESLVAARGRPTADHVDHVTVELHHVHVPKLVDAGVVDRAGSDLRYLGDAFLDEWWFTQ